MGPLMEVRMAGQLGSLEEGLHAAYAREIGARLTRINDVRIFIDEIPADWPMTNPIVPACDFLCHLAEMEPAE